MSRATKETTGVATRIADATRPIHRVNPVAKLAAAFIISLTLIASIDWVSAGVVLLLEAALFGWVGIRLSVFLRRSWPILLASPLAGLTTVLYGEPSGQLYWEFLFIHVTDGSIYLGVATALRILAIGLAGMVMFLTIDPTDLADGLAQVLRLPARFVLGALAAMRLAGLLVEDWRSLGLARRARGVGDSQGFVGKLRLWLNQAFSLLVLALRRGSKLATAMEARGFGADTRRSWARESVFVGRDWLLIAISVLIAATAVAVSIWSGHWNFIFG
ncbi:MAG: energy-coupling factor transporter transmembrane component T [Microbacteriaceae bacterium]